MKGASRFMEAVEKRKNKDVNRSERNFYFDKVAG